MPQITTLEVTSKHGKRITCTVAVGRQEESSTELFLLGAVAPEPGTPVKPGYVFSGTTIIREGRDEPAATLRRANGAALAYAHTQDILFALFSVMDEQPGGIIEQEMNRILG